MNCRVSSSDRPLSCKVPSTQPCSLSVYHKIIFYLNSVISGVCLLKKSKGLKYIFISCQDKVKADLTKGFQTFPLSDT